MKYLIVVDMQNDFIDGALGTPEAVGIIPAVRHRIEQARRDGETVVFTRDTHYENYLNTQEGERLPVTHCIHGTHGWEISSDIPQPLSTEYIFDKPTFGSVLLGHNLQHCTGVESIELIGLCTDICVVSNALLLKAMMPEVLISVDASCCAGVTPASHRAALDTMKSCQIEVKNDGGV